MKKQFNVMMICLALLFVVPSFAEEISKVISLNIFGTQVSNVSSIVQNGEVYVKVKDLAQNMNGDITIDENNNIKIMYKNSIAGNGKLLTTNRTQPAKIGQTVFVEKDDWLDGKSTVEITLEKVIRGTEAEKIIMQSNQFNDKAAEGKEYILANFKVKVLQTENDKGYELNHAMFDYVSGNGIVENEFYSVSMKDTLDTTYYQGSEGTGWTYLLVDKSDKEPLIVLDRNDDSAVWFQLY